jgi:hypothetical protein
MKMSLRREIAVGLLGLASGLDVGLFVHMRNAFNAQVQREAAERLERAENGQASLGPQTIYPAASEGYSQGQIEDGRAFGIEFPVAKTENGGVFVGHPKFYSLDDETQARAFQMAINNAAEKQIELSATQREARKRDATKLDLPKLRPPKPSWIQPK